MTDKREVKFWGHEDVDYLSCTDFDEGSVTWRILNVWLYFTSSADEVSMSMLPFCS